MAELPRTATRPADDGPLEAPASTGRTHSTWRELPLLAALAVVLALLLKTFLVQAFYIPSGSMENTLQVKDRVLVNKLLYRFRDIHRGEVVVFNGLDNFASEGGVPPASNGRVSALRSLSSAIGFGAPGEKDFIKRVIGVPGDRVMCCSADGAVVVQSAGSVPVSLVEPYLFENNPANDPQKYFCDAGQGRAACPPGAAGILVPSGRLWVMGDHRGQSADSRSHVTDVNHGTVPADKVIGRAFLVAWPLGRASVLGVPQTFTSSLGTGAPTPYAAGLALALPVTLLRRRRRR